VHIFQRALAAHDGGGLHDEEGGEGEKSVCYVRALMAPVSWLVCGLRSAGVTCAGIRVQTPIELERGGQRGDVFRVRAQQSSRSAEE
jgi:hypothetical protein